MLAIFYYSCHYLYKQFPNVFKQPGCQFQKPVKKDATKEASASKVSSTKMKSKDGDEEVSKKREQKKKKDPNAPKRAMSGFMFFSNAESEVSLLKLTVVFLVMIQICCHLACFSSNFLDLGSVCICSLNVCDYPCVCSCWYNFVLLGIMLISRLMNSLVLYYALVFLCLAFSVANQFQAVIDTLSVLWMFHMVERDSLLLVL